MKNNRLVSERTLRSLIKSIAERLKHDKLHPKQMLSRTQLAVQLNHFIGVIESH